MFVYANQIKAIVRSAKTFCGCSLALTNTGPAGFMFMWLYVQENHKAQPVVVLI